MKDHWFIGIDFGTTNWSVACLLDHPSHRKGGILHPEVCRADLGNGAELGRFPAVVSRPMDGDPATSDTQLWTGWRVKDHFRRGVRQSEPGLPLVRHRQDIFHSIKADLGAPPGSVSYARAFDSSLETPVKAAAVIFEEILRCVRRSQPGFHAEAARFVITVPAFATERAQQETVEAAELAGIPAERLSLLEEPLAPVVDTLFNHRASEFLSNRRARHILGFSYGGGGCEACLVTSRFRPGGHGLPDINCRGVAGVPGIGGDFLDRGIFEKTLRAQLGIARHTLGSVVWEALRDTLIPTVARGLKESLCARVRERLAACDGDEELAWIRVRHENPTVEIAPFEELQLGPLTVKLPDQLSLSLEEMKRAMQGLLPRCGPGGGRQLPFLEDPTDEWVSCPPVESLLAPVLQVLRKADLQPSDVSAVVVNGGGYKNPLVSRWLRRAFGPGGDLGSQAKVVETVDLDTSTARGAAIACYVQHVRGLAFKQCRLSNLAF